MNIQIKKRINKAIDILMAEYADYFNHTIYLDVSIDNEDTLRLHVRYSIRFLLGKRLLKKILSKDRSNNKRIYERELVSEPLWVTRELRWKESHNKFKVDIEGLVNIKK